VILGVSVHFFVVVVVESVAAVEIAVVGEIVDGVVVAVGGSVGVAAETPVVARLGFGFGFGFGVVVVQAVFSVEVFSVVAGSVEAA